MNKHYVTIVRHYAYYILPLYSQLTTITHLHEFLTNFADIYSCHWYDSCFSDKNSNLMQLDPEYFKKIYDMINGPVEWFQPDVWYNINDYTDEPEKLVFHLKYYIDTRNWKQDLDVELSEDLTSQFRVIELFQGIVNHYNLPVATAKLPSGLPPAPPVPGTMIKEVKGKKPKDPFLQLKKIPKQGDLNL